LLLVMYVTDLWRIFFFNLCLDSNTYEDFASIRRYMMSIALSC
jgi:hypothetical protein